MALSTYPLDGAPIVARNFSLIFLRGRVMRSYGLGLRVTATLQWGRTSMSAEGARVGHAGSRRRRASMGPHFYECGREYRQRRRLPDAGASMGPHFYECGRRLVTFQSSLVRKLQWGRTCMSAEGTKAIPMTTRIYLLQWGRTCMSAEGQSPDSPVMSTRCASMGPHLYECGRTI